MSGGLNRDEARHRAVTVVASRYEVELDLTTGPATFRSRALDTPLDLPRIAAGAST